MRQYSELFLVIGVPFVTQQVHLYVTCRMFVFGDASMFVSHYLVIYILFAIRQATYILDKTSSKKQKESSYDTLFCQIF